jgi:hypothetical protein
LARDRAPEERHEGLPEFLRALDLPEAVLGGDRVGREDEHDRIGCEDQAFQPRPPGFAGEDVLPVEVGLEARRDQGGAELLGKRAVPARVGDEDAGVGWRLPLAAAPRLSPVEQILPPARS